MRQESQEEEEDHDSVQSARDLRRSWYYHTLHNTTAQPLQHKSATGQEFFFTSAYKDSLPKLQYHPSTLRPDTKIVIKVGTQTH